MAIAFEVSPLKPNEQFSWTWALNGYQQTSTCGITLRDLAARSGTKTTYTAQYAVEMCIKPPDSSYIQKIDLQLLIATNTTPLLYFHTNEVDFRKTTTTHNVSRATHGLQQARMHSQDQL